MALHLLLNRLCALDWVDRQGIAAAIFSEVRTMLTPCTAMLCTDVMLQHNSAKPVHFAHVAVVGLHGVCCGLPVLGVLAAALSGAASTASLTSDLFTYFHDFMHHYEIWVLVLSAFLVGVGGWLEAHAHKQGQRQGFPWVLAVSAACLVANFAIIMLHRV